MRVVFVNRYFFPDSSATSQILTDLAFNLAAENHEVEVVASRQLYEDPAFQLSSYDVVRNVKIHRVRTTRFGRMSLVGRAIDYITFYLSLLLSLCFILKRGDIVVAKTDPPMVSVIVGLVAKCKGAKMINWLQDIFPEVASSLGVSLFSSPVTSIVKSIRNWSWRIAINNVVLGERMAQLVYAEGVCSNKVTIIPNWTGDKVESVAHDANPLRKQWGLSDKFVIEYSGNMGRAREFDTLIELARQLRDYSDIVFLFIGDGANKSYIQERVTELGLASFEFKGYQPREELSYSLSVGDVHVVSLLPALEGLIVPSKLYGVAAVGRPVLFFGDAGGEVPLILAREECGITVGIGESEVGVKKLLQLYNDSELRQRMGSNARRMVEEKYNMAASVKKWKLLLSSSA